MAKEVAERLYAIVDGFNRLDMSPTPKSIYSAPGRFFPEQREAYLRSVLKDALCNEAISLGALAERLGGQCEKAAA